MYLLCLSLCRQGHALNDTPVGDTSPSTSSNKSNCKRKIDDGDEQMEDDSSPAAETETNNKRTRADGELDDAAAISGRLTITDRAAAYSY